MNLSELRREYGLASLDVRDVLPSPIAQFQHWFHDASRAEILEPNAMTLSTCSPQGRPSARTVLLKGATDDGFVFFTDYRSRKGMELDATGVAALTFFWKEIERQVRIEGRVERVSDEESAQYFLTRPRGSQVGAWASTQSLVIPNREWLEAQVSEAESRFATGAVPRPAHWGGYRVIPEVVEFWQGRASRLHDRIQYRRTGEGWAIDRLSP